MLMQKLERIPIVGIDIGLMPLPHPYPETNLPMLQGNGLRLTKTLVPNTASRIFLHFMTGSHPKDVRLSGNLHAKVD